MDIEVGRDEALSIAEAYLYDELVDELVSSYSNRTVSFTADNIFEAYFRETRATPSERALLTQHSAPYYWIVTLSNPSSGSRYKFNISISGDIFALTYTPPVDLAGKRLSQEQAESITRSYFETMMPIDWETYSRLDAETAERDARTDHTFSWRSQNPVVGEARYTIQATVMGDQVRSWQRTIEFPRGFQDRFTQRENRSNLFEIIQIILAIFLWIISLIVFALRFRASEVSVRNGLIVVALFMAFLTLFWGDTFSFFVELAVPEDASELGRLVPYINIGLQIFFSSFALFFIWTSGESIARDLWPGKLRAIDGIFARNLFFPDLGRGIMRGYALGLGQLGIWYAFVALALDTPDAWPTVSFLEQQILSAQSASLLFIPFASLSSAITEAFLTAGYPVLFAFAFLKKLTRNTAIAIAIPWIVFSILFSDTTVLYPRWTTSIIGVCTGIFIYLFFLRYDVLTVAVGSFVNVAVPSIFMHIYHPHTDLTIAGIVGAVILAGVFAYGVAARVRGVPLKEDAIEPAYARNISERQRLKLELDVARRAQLQMLPRTIPQAKGLDIAAFSEPAREVGGDYFDFFHLDEHRLGFAVGDVSGKGMPAALYMTLLKGSLQSQASQTTSPQELLSHINKTFYDAAERNTFVTLFYGVIDVRRSVLTFARAGHNPVLIYRPIGEVLFFLKPPGLGIGLEKGDIFDRTLAEESFSLQPSDVIIVYTDGLTEARNGRDEEFGQDRLNELIKSGPFNSAEDLLQRIKHGYHSFTGKSDPHDDLTCLIIKVQ